MVSDDALAPVARYRPTPGPHPYTAEGLLAVRADGRWFYRARLLQVPADEDLPALVPEGTAQLLAQVDMLKLTLESLAGAAGGQRAAQVVQELKRLHAVPELVAWSRALHTARKEWLRARPATTLGSVSDWMEAPPSLAVLARRARTEPGLHGGGRSELRRGDDTAVITLSEG